MRYYLVSVHERDDEGVEIGAVDIDHALSTDGMRDVTVAEAHHVQQLIPGVHTFAAEIEVS